MLTLGFAFPLTSEGWRGNLAGRLPPLQHEKALIINTTLFTEEAYRAGLGEAIWSEPISWAGNSRVIVGGEG
jgi:NAD(P)H dehydrogenase (quinone)